MDGRPGLFEGRRKSTLSPNCVGSANGAGSKEKGVPANNRYVVVRYPMYLCRTLILLGGARGGGHGDGRDDTLAAVFLERSRCQEYGPRGECVAGICLVLCIVRDPWLCASEDASSAPSTSSIAAHTSPQRVGVTAAGTVSSTRGGGGGTTRGIAVHTRQCAFSRSAWLHVHT